jgi:hypothetical protein
MPTMMMADSRTRAVTYPSATASCCRLTMGNSTTAVPTSFRQRGAQVLDWLTELTGCTPSHSMYIQGTRVHPHATARMCERSVRLRANLFETWSKQRDFELAQRPGTRHRRGDGQIARKTGGNLCR